MTRQFAALLWKEWRQGWLTMLLLCSAVPFAGWLHRQFLPSGSETSESLETSGSGEMTVHVSVPFAGLGLLALIVASALVAARLFASEAESGTARFVLRQPVRPGVLWWSKLVAGALSLLVLYVLWLWSRAPPECSPAGVLPDAPDPEELHSRLIWVLWPLGSFSVALLLSAAIDNTPLAFIGGCVLGEIVGLLPVALLASWGWSSRVVSHRDLYFEPLTFVGALVPVAAFLALSRVAFQIRARR